MTYRQAIEQASTTIARRDAETLLLHLTGEPRAYLLAHPEASLAPAHEAALRDLVTRRAAHEPLQYITGRQEFFGLDLLVTSAVLIPRPETELLVEAVLNALHPQGTPDPHPEAARPRIVDVGTGSGAIALALASQLPTAEITAVDLSPEALAVAARNADRLHLAHRVDLLRSDLLDAVPEMPSLDAVVSNPPYVPDADAAGMQPEVVRFEPHLALFAGADGLGIYKRLIPQAWRRLRHGGLLAMEFGYGQTEQLSGLLQGWQDVQFTEDYAGIPRIVTAVRP